MVEKIQLEIDKKKQYNKYERAKPFVAIGILLIYIFMVATTIIIIDIVNKKPKMAIGERGVSGTRSYCEIILYNLKPDGSIITIDIDEFEFERQGSSYDAYGFKTDDMTDISTNDKFAVVCDEKEKKFVIYFESGSAGFMYYSGGNCYYDDNKLDTKPTAEIQKAERTGIIVIETIGILFIWLVISMVLNNLSYKADTSYRLKNINKKAIEKLKEHNFNATKTFYLHTSKSGENELEKMMICIDSKSKKCCLIDYQKKKAFIVGFNDIISHNIIENNAVKIEEEPSMFGMPPTQTTKNVCKKLSLVVVIDDLDDTSVVYDLIKNTISIESSTYKRIIDSTIQVTSFFEIIKNKSSSASFRQGFVFCEYCGAKNRAESLRCESCGAQLKE